MSAVSKARVPELGESVTEATLAAWLAADGAAVAEGDPICEIESDKATMEIFAPASGTLVRAAAQGDALKVGAVLATIEEGPAAEKPAAEKSAAEKPAAEKSAPRDAAPEPGARMAETPAARGPRPSPAAAKILDEGGVEPASVRGSGRDGRITKADALAAARTAQPARDAQPAQPPAQVPAQVPAQAARAQAPPGARGTRTEPVSRLRRAIAERLVAAGNSTATLTTFNEIDMGAAAVMRRRFGESFLKRHGVKLGYMSIFARAVCLALGEVPKLNARYGDDGVVHHDYCDLGVAVSTPKGLVVPVVKNAESRSLAGLETEIKRLAERARAGKLAIDEMRGGTFTITNGGVFGSMLSTPILNHPESGILGMHNIVERPVAREGGVVVRPVMYAALSYDHRIVDGRESVTFLKRVKELVEDPERMLLDA